MRTRLQLVCISSIPGPFANASLYPVGPPPEISDVDMNKSDSSHLPEARGILGEASNSAARAYETTVRNLGYNPL